MIKKAIEYNKQGYNVIPLIPDKKIPAGKWEHFQTVSQSITDIENLFGSTCGNIGIITGRGLAVLDFDKTETFREFANLFPHIMRTYTVKTPRGFHLYYRINEDLPTRHNKAAGIDFQCSGAYVVAPPSQVDDKQYRVMLDAPALRLDGHELADVLRFLERVHKYADRGADLVQRSETDNNRFSQAGSPVGTDNQNNRFSRGGWNQETDNDLSRQIINKYWFYHQQYGRNDTLFLTAIWARDRGISSSDFADIISTSFVQGRPPQGHAPQSATSRSKELNSTVASAYTQPARAVGDSVQLWNTIREKLNQKKLTAVARTLDGLRSAGYMPGDIVSYTDAKETLAGLVGDWSIRKTFASDILEQLETDTPPDPPIGVITPAFEIALGTNKNCICLPCQNQQKPIKTGKPRTWFIMPSNAQLASRLECDAINGCDNLSTEDIAGAKAYRKAVHKRFTDRRPTQPNGKHHNAYFLASRVGVSKRTIKRYINEISGRTGATIHETPLHLGMKFDFDSDSRRYTTKEGKTVTRGIWLIDESGKKYPALEFLAVQLLKDGHTVSLIEQGTAVLIAQPQEQPQADREVSNRFSNEADRAETINQKSSFTIDSRSDTGVNFQETINDNRFSNEADRAETINQKPLGVPFAIALQQAPQPKRRNYRSPKRKYKNPLEGDKELKAQRVYQSVENLSIYNARRIVETYEIDIINKALKILPKRTTTNPAGFFMQCLKTAQKVKQKQVYKYGKTAVIEYGKD